MPFLTYMSEGDVIELHHKQQLVTLRIVRRTANRIRLVIAADKEVLIKKVNKTQQEVNKD